MFYLSLVEHNLQLPPHLFNRSLLDAIKEELERLFLDKVQLIYLLLDYFPIHLCHFFMLISYLSGYCKSGPMYLCT